MASPYPKPDGERRNRNAKPFAWTALPAAGRKGKTPSLPTVAGHRWMQSTVAWWKKLWATPQATQWREDDPELTRLALIHQTVWLPGAAPAAALLSEMRQIEDRHGLNPKAMLQLRWRIEEAEPEVKPETTERKRAGGARRANIIEMVKRAPEDS